jgi:hypothetical protein
MVHRGLNAYQTIWGATEQPTTLNNLLVANTFGQQVKFNVAGNIVGMRWGRHNNVTDKGAVGVVSNPGTDATILRSCTWAPRTRPGTVDLGWTNSFIHPFLHVAANTTLKLWIITNGIGVSYNDGALLAGPLTIGNFTYPQDIASSKNGSIDSGSIHGYPSGAANGRRFTIDVLFLPD